MTVKELKAFLETAPDEASVEFKERYSWESPQMVRITLQREFKAEVETVEA